jgi:hypothetical protein
MTVKTYEVFDVCGLLLCEAVSNRNYTRFDSNYVKARYPAIGSMEQTISDFLCNTCRVHPKPSRHKFNALYHCVYNASMTDEMTVITAWIVTSSGSASEFYIEPMLSCINDYDVMYHRNDVLAIPTGHSVPRCLPAEFHHRVKVYQLMDTEFPGYVTAESICELIKCNNDDYYECFPTESATPQQHFHTITQHDTDLLNKR